jgi:hypothetical protein
MKIKKPPALRDWEQLLLLCGAIIVSGKVGAADWGSLGGIGHYVLIVGVDTKDKELLYKDPLKGDRLRNAAFDHMNGRMKDDTYIINGTTLKNKLNNP